MRIRVICSKTKDDRQNPFSKVAKNNKLNMSHIFHSNIRIDNFQYMRNDLTKYCFFLSHCHEDHIMGLNSSWNYGRIYASWTSKVLICDRFPNLEKHVVSARPLNYLHLTHTFFPF